MKGHIGIVAVCLVFLAGSGSAQGPQITIPGLGVVQGQYHRSWVSNREFSSFRGVPFADPPVGALRFQPPAPLSPWEGVLNATSNGQRCPQTGIGAKYKFWDFQSPSMADERASDDKEDCLYLHIHTPNTAAANLPVMVFFHGGGFLTGSALIYDGVKFMDHDVVLVVPHYRLGPLGFLSLETNAIPGNAGMLDQVAALQWVKNNIGVFGGDPNRITVFGESAGGASSGLLSISPLSTGLFQQYISQSGAATAEWAIDREPIRAARDLAQLINCTGSDIPTLTACFQNVDAMELVVAFDTLVDIEVKAGRSGFAGSSPTIQKAGSVRFLEKDPLEILEEGSFVAKPALMGSNKNEGTLVYSIEHTGYLQPNGLLEDPNYFKRDFTKFMLNFFGIKDQGETIAVGIENAYFGEANVGNLTAMTPGVIDFAGDMFLKAPVFSQAQYNSLRANTYMYTFNFLGDTSLWRFIGDPSVIPGGVCHANELVLMFDIPGFLLNARERTMARNMINLWVNFATFGDPTPVSSPVEGVPTWPKFDLTDGYYMRLNDQFEVKQDYTSNEYFVAVQENFPW